jgi:hypothetical protein
MKKIIALFFLTIFVSCSNETITNKEQITQQKAETKSDSSTQKEKDVEITKSTSTIFFIKDSSNYSPNFLKEFKGRHGFYKSVSLIDDTIIINNDRKGCIIIPVDLPLNSVVSYKAKKDGKNYSLKVKRINYSTIEYALNGQKGVADLQPVFYMGAEGTFEDKNGTTYGMNKYIDYSEKECKYILIGVGNIEKSTLTYCAKEGQLLTTIDFIK